MSRRLRHPVRSIPAPLAALVLAALLAGCTATGGDATATPPGDQSGGASASATSAAGSSAGPADTSSGADGSTARPTATVTGSSGEDGAASEILPESSGAPSPSLGVEFPHLAAAPASASAHGTLVAGYPSDLVPVPEGTTIVASSVTSQGDHVQVGVTGTEDAEPDQVGAAYTTRMTGLGYLTASADAASGSTATQYVRGRDVVVLTLRPRTGGGSELVLTGVLVVGG